MKRTKLLLLAVSLMLGFTGTCAFADYLPEARPVSVSQIAWWGGVYPEYCLPGAMELSGEMQVTEGESNVFREGQLPVKVRFKYLTFLNDRGENHE